MRAVAQVLPIKKDLLEWDPDGDTSVWIKPVRQAESQRRSVLANRVKWERDPQTGEEVRVFEGPGDERKVLECWLTFHDANIMEEIAVDDADLSKGTKLVQMFQRNMNEKDFRKAFARLEDDLADEWWLLVLEVNPQWDDLGLSSVSKA